MPLWVYLRPKYTKKSLCVLDPNYHKLSRYFSIPTDLIALCINNGLFLRCVDAIETVCSKYDVCVNVECNWFGVARS